MRRLMPQHGLSMIELLIALTIAAILAAAAAPMFSDYLVNSRLREAGNSLFSEVMFAQSEAIKRNGIVRVSISGSSLQVTDRSTEGANAIIRERVLPNTVAADAAADMNFGSEGRPVPLGTAYTVDLSLSGVTCSSEHRCPSLRVEAGGAMRLCGDRLNCT